MNGLEAMGRKAPFGIPPQDLIAVLDCCGLAGWFLPWESWELSTRMIRWRDIDGNPLPVDFDPKSPVVFLYSASAQPSKSLYDWAAHKIRKLHGDRFVYVNIDSYMTEPCDVDWDEVYWDIVHSYEARRSKHAGSH